MTYLAASLYALGIVGAVSAIRRDAYGRYVPTGLREWVVIVAWPVAVAAAIVLGLAEAARRSVRP
jgi:hypothetical protein